MRRVMLALGFSIVLGASSSKAHADSPAASAAGARGVIVVGVPGATDGAWPLAQAIYLDPSVRPPSMDDAHARVLCGEGAPPNATQDVRDLAEMAASVRADDAPSRAILADIALRFSARAVLVVGAASGRVSARVFLPETRAFDAVTYAPDDGASLSWSAATRSVVRTFGTIQAPPLATHDAPLVAVRQREFYESGWFWGALGAAAVAGGAVFLATRDNGATAIHLHLEVPH